MRPLVHPAVEDITVEALLHALSDPVRVAIYVEIIGQSCSANCSTFQHVIDKPIPKSTLSQHFRILREAGLIRSERRGVEMLNTSRCAEVDARFPGLMAAVAQAYEIQLADTAHPRRPAKSATKQTRRGAGKA